MEDPTSFKDHPMPAYATQSDIVTLYGANALYVADHNRDGVADSAAVTRALTSASDEIDTYLAARYTLPLTEVPGFLRTLTVDIALYRLALSADVLSEEHRKRYEDALGHLKRIARGEAALVFTPVPPVDGQPDVSAAQPIVSGGPAKLFTRDLTRDL
jgi:phage gp36-like protein